MLVVHRTTAMKGTTAYWNHRHDSYRAGIDAAFAARLNVKQVRPRLQWQPPILDATANIAFRRG